jgi:HSP20 family molecular chaperone IbpA
MINTLNSTNRLARNILDEVFEPLIFPREERFASFRLDGDSYFLELEMAGVTKEEVKAEVLDGKILISAKTKRKSFNFSSGVPKDADRSSITATIKDGLLTIELKKAEEAKGHIIKIN